MKRGILLSLVFGFGLLNLCAGRVAANYTQLGPTMPPPCPDSGCILSGPLGL